LSIHFDSSYSGTMKALVFATLAAVTLGVGLVAQAAQTATATLVVGGAVKTPLTLTAADLAKMPVPP
jgi:DMSO/TMAO reductase YedYZ molybdopterin-dependent catalytic subunit